MDDGVRIMLLPFLTLGNFVHSSLLQFTQLHKRVPNHIQWWIKMNECMLPREVNLVFK